MHLSSHSFKNKREGKALNGNVFERTWFQAQDVALVLKSNGADGAAPWCVTEHVTITNNIIRNAPRGVLINGFEGGATTRANHIKIENNLFDSLSGDFMQIASADNVKINHNTVLNSGDTVKIPLSDPSVNFVFTNTIVQHGYYGVVGAGTGTGTDQGRSSTFDRYFLGYAFTKNALVGAGPPPYGRFSDPSTWYPAGNFYPTTYDSVGFVDRAGGNYRLASNSAYKNAGTDGKDLGADIGAINAAMNPISSPFTGTPAAVPGVIEAENFDNGGEGVAYHDTDVGNNGNAYRTTNVDVRAVTSAGNGYVVFNAFPGEWLKYTLNVQSAGTYNIGASVASRLEGGTFHFEIDGVDVTGSLKAPTTGSWSAFQTVSKSGVMLTSGTHVLRLVLDAAGVEGIIADFDSISLTQASLPSPWLNQDIGNVGVAGSASYSNQTFTVNASGIDMSGDMNNPDSFHYVYQTLNGNGQIIARVTGIPSPAGNGGGAKAGIMIRENLTGGSQHVTLALNPNAGASFEFISRGGSFPYAAGGAGRPYWVKLVRNGSTISGFISGDGINWTPVASTSITMASNVYIGLAVVSHVNTTLAAGTFDNVTVSAP